MLNIILDVFKAVVVGRVTDSYDLEGLVEKLERETIREVMKIVSGNKYKAANMLKIKRTKLHYKLEKYGIKLEEVVGREATLQDRSKNSKLVH